MVFVSLNVPMKYCVVVGTAVRNVADAPATFAKSKNNLSLSGSANEECHAILTLPPLPVRLKNAMKPGALSSVDAYECVVFVELPVYSESGSS